MNVADFQRRLDAHGPELATWPRRARAKADALLARDAAARAALVEAQGLDATLRRAGAPLALEALRERIMADPALTTTRARSTAAAAWFRRPRAALAGGLSATTAALACLALGFYVGVANADGDLFDLAAAASAVEQTTETSDPLFGPSLDVEAWR